MTEGSPVHNENESFFLLLLILSIDLSGWKKKKKLTCSRFDWLVNKSNSKTFIPIVSSALNALWISGSSPKKGGIPATYPTNPTLSNKTHFISKCETWSYLTQSPLFAKKDCNISELSNSHKQ